MQTEDTGNEIRIGVSGITTLSDPSVNLRRVTATVNGRLAFSRLTSIEDAEATMNEARQQAQDYIDSGFFKED